MIRHLFGRIAALLRPASISTRTGRKRMAATKDLGKDLGKMAAGRPAGCVGQDAGQDAAAARISPDDLLAGAMMSLGIDFDRLARCDSPWLAEMRFACRACSARSRCRRDLATGDFTRRYRHYCRNADSLALLAAAEQHLPDTPRTRQEH
jgi:hypothetical protein